MAAECARPLMATISFATASTLDLLRPDRKTSAPSAANSLATGEPIEPPAPNTTARLPFMIGVCHFRISGKKNATRSRIAKWKWESRWALIAHAGSEGVELHRSSKTHAASRTRKTSLASQATKEAVGWIQGTVVLIPLSSGWRWSVALR